jgi:hypothetical protein
MTLTVEDGTGVANADSYIGLIPAKNYAISRGLSFAGADSIIEQNLRVAFDYVESFAGQFVGLPTVLGQVLQWPRSGVFLNGVELSSTTIPLSLQYAQVQAALAINAGFNPLATGSGTPFVVREKVGPLETQYSESVSTSGLPILRGFAALIGQFLVTSGAGSLLSTARA